MKNKTVTRTTRPFTRSCQKWLLLGLPDNVTKILFDTLSTKDAAILSAVNQQLRNIAIAHFPASWVDIWVDLPTAEKLDPFLIFLARLATNATSLGLFIDTNTIDINYLQLFPVMPNVRWLNLSKNRWLQCNHLDFLANRMPAVTQLVINDCLGLMDDNQTPPTDPCLDIVHRNYGRQLTLFRWAVTEPRFNDVKSVQYNYANNMMVSLMSNMSSMTEFSMRLFSARIP